MFPRRDLAWRYWFLTVILLAVGLLAKWQEAIPLVIGLSVVQVVHFIWREQRWTSFPVQVRLAYLGLLLLGLWPSFGWVHWIQFIGTTARVTVGYCLLSRMLSLLPWNRTETLSGELVYRTFFTYRYGLTCTTFRPA